jgi:hypothetical protein
VSEHVLKRFDVGDERGQAHRLPGCTGQASIADHIVSITVRGLTRAQATDLEASAGRTKSTVKRAARKRLPQKPHPGA